MLTQTHALVAAALLAPGGERRAVAAVVGGALLPDADLWAMIAVEFAAGRSGCEIFHYSYHEPPWTTVQAVLNSIPLWAVLAAGAGLAKWLKFAPQAAGIVALFALAGLLHVVADFALHHDDARQQLWPVSDWVFRSPLSYWDPQHHGRLVAAAEIALGTLLALRFWRRAGTRPVRVLLSAALALYLIPVIASFAGAADHDRGPGSCELRGATAADRRR